MASNPQPHNTLHATPHRAILTMKVKLHVLSCTIEMEYSSTLEDLHYFTQQTVEFDDDHLYKDYH